MLDAMVARPDVDPDRVALIGISQAGYWVPRALALEHRFVAAVADPGVVDVSTSWTKALPGFGGTGWATRCRHHHTDPDHRARGRAVLARPVPGALRPAAGPRDLVRFTAAEGANRHCEPMGLAIRDARLFDWLDHHLAA